jgi:hypothetical protein
VTAPAPSSSLLDELVSVARLRLGLPAAAPDEVRGFYPGDLDGFWVVPLFQGEAGRVLVLYAPDGEVAAHAGLDCAARRVLDAGVLDRDPAWLGSNIRAVLDATGGLTPGYPRYADEEGRALDGGAEVVLREPVGWVRWAAAGAPGPPPVGDHDNSGPRSGGIAPPPTAGRIAGRMLRSGELTWTYELAEGEVTGRFSGDASAVTPGAPCGGVDAFTAETAIAKARAALGSPFAVPAAPVAAEASGAFRVELLGHEAVVVEAGA